jgi:hypothetical protein
LFFKENHIFERFFCLFQLDFSHLLLKSRSGLQIHNFLGFPDSIIDPFPLLQVPGLAFGIVDVRGVGLRGETLGGEVDEAKLVSDRGVNSGQVFFAAAFSVGRYSNLNNE